MCDVLEYFLFSLMHIDNYFPSFIVHINMSSLPYNNILPTSPELSFLYVLGMVIFLILILSLLALLVRDEIWEKQHNI